MIPEDRVVLSPLEAAFDTAIGDAVHEQPLPPGRPEITPLVALEQAILPALERAPCLVLFSGGRDSSLLLAVAARVARREGLPLPIPTTHTFPRFAETDEAAWQNLVLRHLQLDERLIQTFGDEVNLLGPEMRTSIARLGLLSPAGAHLLVPTLTEAHGGSIVTGYDGDGLFNGGRFGHVRAALVRSERPTFRSALTLARGIAPPALRRTAYRHRGPDPPEWLQPGAASAIREMLAYQDATEPMTWNTYVKWLARRRYLVAWRQVLRFIGQAHDVLDIHPFMNPRFLSALAFHGGALGWGDRTSTMRSLSGRMLPDEVLARSSKAVFTRPYWSGDVKRFAAGWDGSGLPTDLVDADKLREVWLRERPDARTGFLLHTAWAAANLPIDQREKPFNVRLE